MNALRSNLSLPLLSSCTPNCLYDPYPGVCPLLTALSTLFSIARVVKSPVSGPPVLLDALYAEDVVICDSAPLAASIIACILSAIASGSDATVTETGLPGAVVFETVSDMFGTAVLKVLVGLVRV